MSDEEVDQGLAQSLLVQRKIARVTARLKGKTPVHRMTRHELIQEIEAWQNDDAQGYFEAIELLVAAGAVLRAAEETEKLWGGAGQRAGTYLSVSPPILMSPPIPTPQMQQQYDHAQHTNLANALGASASVPLPRLWNGSAGESSK